MKKIRSSEEKLRLLKNQPEMNENEVQFVSIHNPEQQEIETVQESDVETCSIEISYKTEDLEENQDQQEVVRIEDSPKTVKGSKKQIIITSPKRKKRRMINNDTTVILLYTHYDLEKDEDENRITLVISKREEEYFSEPINFESSTHDYMNHCEDSCIYKCSHCVKAFSNSEHLIKHTVISHLCVLCHEVFPNFKELNLHTKNNTKKDLYCKMCDEYFDHSTFKHHLKVKHKITSSPQVGVTFFSE